MAIKVNGTTVIDDSKNFTNIQSVTFPDASVLSSASVNGTVNLNSAFSIHQTGGTLVHTLDNPNIYTGGTGDRFGSSLAISGNYAIVGAYQEDDSDGGNTGRVYIYDVTTGLLIHVLNNPNAFGTNANDQFGRLVAISGNYAIVSAYLEDDAGGVSSGKAYIFNVTTGALVHTLDNPNAYGTSQSDNFGFSVGISGNYAIVGAYVEDESGGLNSGKAYIFNVTTGALLHTLDNPNPYSGSTFDAFGSSVAISGNYAIVSAPDEDDAGGLSSGKAYIFNVTTGQLLHTLDNPNAYDTSAEDEFGYSLAIDGNYAIVGAYFEDDAGGTGSGKAYIFNVTTGALVHTLDNPNAYSTSANDNFGNSVGMSGNYAIVGAVFEDDTGGFTSGKAYIFNVTTGALVHTLDDPNAYSTSASDQFGVSVAISGNYVIVGAATESDSIELFSGKAYILTVDDIYNVNHVDKIQFSNGSELRSDSELLSVRVNQGELVNTLDNPNAYGTSFEDNFGWSVAISGNYAIVGARFEDDSGGSASGKAYIFNVTTGALLHTLDNPNAYGTSFEDNFGWSVAISGNYAIVGAHLEDDAGGTSSGKAYIFNVTTGALLHTLDNPNPFDSSLNDYFGESIAMSGNYAIVGAYGEDDSGGLTSGKAYIFNVTTGTLVHTLDNPNAYGTSTSDYFSVSVAIDGNYAIVGASIEGDAGGNSSGKAYIFNVITGALLHTLDNPNAYDTSANDRFGDSVGISGNYAIVGANNEDDAGGTSSGKAYIFNVTTGALVHTLDNPNAYGISANDNFGYSVAMSGNYAIVGAHGEDESGGGSSGKAYIFNVTTGALVHTLDNPNAYDTSTSDEFGFSVSISGNYAIVATRVEDDSGGTSSGKAYIFATKDLSNLDRLYTMVQ
jgi:hypothetical protein